MKTPQTETVSRASFNILSNSHLISADMFIMLLSAFAIRNAAWINKQLTAFLIRDFLKFIKAIVPIIIKYNQTIILLKLLFQALNIFDLLAS
jgi:hypothetical protein